jgi:hypothetical protein
MSETAFLRFEPTVKGGYSIPRSQRVIVVHPRIRLELGENLDMAAKPDVDRQLISPKIRLLDPDSCTILKECYARRRTL